MIINNSIPNAFWVELRSWVLVWLCLVVGEDGRDCRWHCVNVYLIRIILSCHFNRIKKSIRIIEIIKLSLEIM